MKIGWVLVLIVSIIIVINGLAYVVTGAESDTQFFQHQAGISWSAFASSGQGIVTYVQGLLRLFGVITAIAGTFAATITVTAFRRGERWAFYILFLAAVGLLYATGDLYYGGGSTWPVYLILLAVDIVGLLLPFRTFFPKQTGTVR
ncbi:MAG TPA: hypothetical protein VEI80_00155 [Candidatus Acidoferrales bacterium]|nr:hypothetical protein [Candidatus Acidoferrales bacterium]